MTAALPSGVVVGIATFTSYLVAYQGRTATPAEQMQASTAALITLLVTGCGCWRWWHGRTSGGGWRWSSCPAWHMS